MAQLARLACTAGTAAILLTACGGGTSQIEPFKPAQYVVLGDESSLIDAQGRRYTVNPHNANTGALDCTLQPIWTQAVANRFGFVFAECNPGGATEFRAQMRASAGARVGDIEAQIDAQLADGGFAEKSLVTVMAGGNDILALYADYPRRSEEELVAQARELGVRVGMLVNHLIELGPRVVVSTIPDLGLSPYALAEQAAHTDTDRAALISRLVAAFNGRIRTTIVNDGRYVGLVLADEIVQAIARAPSPYGVKNATSPVCTVALPDCTDRTLVESGNSSSWLWADDRRLAFGGQLYLGNLAVARVANNPF